MREYKIYLKIFLCEDYDRICDISQMIKKEALDI